MTEDERAVLLMGQEKAHLWKIGNVMFNIRRPRVEEVLSSLKTPEVKALAKSTGRKISGLTTRKNFEDVIFLWLADYCQQDSGYARAAGYGNSRVVVPELLAKAVR